jgi:hypothetical protein
MVFRSYRNSLVVSLKERARPELRHRGRNRFIANDDVRLNGQGPCDSSTLALPSAELMEVAIGHLPIETHQVEEFFDPPLISLAFSRQRILNGSLTILPAIIRRFSDH